MSGNGGRGYRNPKRYTDSPDQADENWYVKPIIDQAQVTASVVQPDEDGHYPELEFISSLPSSLPLLSEFIPQDASFGVKFKSSKNDESTAHCDVERENLGDGHDFETEDKLKGHENSRIDEINTHFDAKEVYFGHGNRSEMENELEHCEDSRKGDERSGNVDKDKEEFDQQESTEREEEVEEDVLIRLEELRLGVGEPELSGEMLRMNFQAQDDELLALESIYGDNIFILDRQDGLQSFQIHVQIDAVKELMVSAQLSSSSSLDRNDDSSDFMFSFKIEHLPPIILTCLFPESYPSHLAPYFTLSVQWLDSAKISNLCHMLDSMWKERRGQEVIYQWVEWLHSSSLSYLGLVKEIILGPYGVKHLGDRRAISLSDSPDIDILVMKSYNDEQHHENFCRNFHECRICFSQFIGTDFIKLPCYHFFCWNCMKTYSNMFMKEHRINKPLCPDEKCGDMIPPGLLKRLLGDEEFERWEELTFQKTLESMFYVTYCPRCETICIEDGDHHAQCAKCYFSFCTLCKERRHVGVACMTSEMKLLILKERQNLSQLSDEQRRREQDTINELVSVQEIHRFAKQCPSCKMAISWSGGCNRMQCENCGEYFCYRCNQAVDQYYEHYREGKCELYSPERATQMWEERMNSRYNIGQIQEPMFVERAHNCPNCRQVNLKVGNNNHIFCWACQKHYCYSCRKMVRRSSQHYGPRGCKQHTAG